MKSKIRTILRAVLLTVPLLGSLMADVVVAKDRPALKGVHVVTVHSHGSENTESGGKG